MLFSTCIFIVYLGLLKKKNDVLRLLLNLECLVLLIFIWFRIKSELFFSSLFLRVGACEAAVGLGILVSYIRNTGLNHIRLFEYALRLSQVTYFL